MERAHDEVMDGEPTLPERPHRRRTSPRRTSSLIVETYDRCTGNGDKGALLRREGLYSSTVTEWRRARDAGALGGLEAKRRPAPARRPSSTSPGRPVEPNGPRPSWPSPAGHRDPGKSIRALGAAAGREHHGRQAVEISERRRLRRSRAARRDQGRLSALGRSRASHYRRAGPRCSVHRRPADTGERADPAERDAVLELLHGRFVDAAPAQAWAILLDEGTYLASESTMYRLLRAGGESAERRRQATHPPRTIPELVAEEPNRVWSYDVTKLKGPRRGVHYDLFVMLDIFSRYCRAGWSSTKKTARSRRPGSPR